MVNFYFFSILHINIQFQKTVSFVFYNDFQKEFFFTSEEISIKYFMYSFNIIQSENLSDFDISSLIPEPFSHIDMRLMMILYQEIINTGGLVIIYPPFLIEVIFEQQSVVFLLFLKIRLLGEPTYSYLGESGRMEVERIELEVVYM